MERGYSGKRGGVLVTSASNLRDVSNERMIILRVEQWRLLSSAGGEERKSKYLMASASYVGKQEIILEVFLDSFYGIPYYEKRLAESSRNLLDMFPIFTFGVG